MWFLCEFAIRIGILILKPLETLDVLVLESQCWCLYIHLFQDLSVKPSPIGPENRLHFIENDCVDIDDYVVFGSEVMMCTDMHAPWVPLEYSRKMERKRGLDDWWVDFQKGKPLGPLKPMKILHDNVFGKESIRIFRYFPIDWGIMMNNG